MGIDAKKFRLTLVIGLALFVGLAAVAGTFQPVTVTDQTLTAPLANPVPSFYQPRYISGFGSDDSFTVFFEDRDALVPNTISYASTTIGPTGFPASVTATNIADTHFLVKDWPITIGVTTYAYRAWGSVGNNIQHHFYVSNDLTNWIPVSTFTIPNATGFTGARGWVYYGFHDVILLNGTYYAFAESNQGQTLLVRSVNGDDAWEAFDKVGGTLASDGPLQLPESGTPSGSFVSLGYDRGYGKIHVRGNDSGFYLAVNTAAVASLAPAALEAAFIDPANWTWHDGTTGLPASPILSLTTEHDLRECWVVPSTDPDADWVIIYDADFGSGDGGKALGYATLSPPLLPAEIVWVDDDYCDGCANNGHTWGYDAFATIQDGIDNVAGSTVNVAAGTYTEAILIDKPLTLRGATAGVNKNGYAVPADYAWDDTVESIINHPNPSGGYITIVDIYNVGNVTFEGFVVQELDAEANLNSSLVRVYAHTREIDNIVVRNNIIGPNTNTTSQDGKQGRMGLYIVNHPYDDNGVINSTFSGNKIFDCRGNGNNVFLWSSYYAYGAPGPASMSGTVIEDNEIYGSHRSGIETAGGFSGLTIRSNKIYDNSGLPSDDADALKYGNGILLIRGSGDKTGGPTTAYGPEDLTIENNDIYNNEKNGIYMGPINHNYTITGNDIHNNGWDGIRLDLGGSYHSPDFDPTSGPWPFAGGSLNIEAHFNNISENTGYGVRVVGTPTNGFVFGATCNWWGDPSGPSGVGSGLGDAVSGAVDFDPWLLAPGPNAPCGGILMGSFVIDHAKIDFKKKPDDDKVRVQGRLELDLVSGIVDISEKVIVTVGPLSETITMEEKGKKGDKWEYKRPKHDDGLIQHMTIDWKNGRFDIRMDKADLTGVTNPVFISIRIGDDVGLASILMREHKHHWDYRAEHGPKAVEIEPLAITDELKVVAYPNPVRDVNTATFQVMGALAAEVEEIWVQIYGLSGRLVWEDTAPGSELDWHTDSLSGDYLANGFYLYSVQIRIGETWIYQDIGKIAVMR